MKLGGWVVMLVAMVLFLTLVGIPTTLNNVLEGVGMNITATGGTPTVVGDVESSDIWDWIFGLEGFVATFVLGSVITLGLYLYTKDKAIILVPLIASTANLFAGTFWGLIMYVKDFNQTWMTYMVLLIFGSLSVGFLWACVDYFKET